MSGSPALTPAQCEQFERDGYCLVDGLYDDSTLTAMEAFFEAYRERGDAVFDKGSRYAEIDPTKRQLRAMHPHRHSERVRAWFLHPPVAAVLKALFGRPALGAQTMYYFKPPGSKGQGMHQDNFYLRAAPATCIAAWTPIDDATVENGCLYVAPGSHRREILCPHDGAESWMEYGDSHIKPFPRELKPVPVPVRRGQTLFFGGNLVHGSGPNRTKDRSRRTFIGHYLDAASEEVAEFYHPVLTMSGETVGDLGVPIGGGPCGDGFGPITY